MPVRAAPVVILVFVLGGDPAPVAAAEPVAPKLFGELRKMASPRAAHARLQSLIGRWSVNATYRITPTARPAAARGEAEYRWILGGRFVEQHIRLTARSRVFEGRGTWGFDNYGGHYVASWIDNFDSGISRLRGHWDDAADAFMLEIESNDVRTGTRAVHASRLQVPNRDTHTWTVLDTDPRSGRRVPLIRLEFVRLPK